MFCCVLLPVFSRHCDYLICFTCSCLPVNLNTSPAPVLSLLCFLSVCLPRLPSLSFWLRLSALFASAWTSIRVKGLWPVSSSIAFGSSHLKTSQIAFKSTKKNLHWDWLRYFTDPPKFNKKKQKCQSDQSLQLKVNILSILTPPLLGVSNEVVTSHS